jgi:hypothetical protein
MIRLCRRWACVCSDLGGRYSQRAGREDQLRELSTAHGEAGIGRGAQQARRATPLTMAIPFPEVRSMFIFLVLRRFCVPILSGRAGSCKVGRPTACASYRRRIIFLMEPACGPALVQCRFVVL